ncbi:antibiotic biosynthesis monooxygenase [Polaribacter sp.]|uniref:antibiotic biosynthesis monooxygenase family protein n=1 Tax=Polaribacter sp. TaxID=1920175 RepID=UPI0025EF5743|nr:antibiotic biosynthesis monooxygenase [Polaribacter sp.]
MIVAHLKPPYYAVIFTTIKADNTSGYDQTALRMGSLAKKQDGFLGIESARADLGITVSYWQSLADIQKWRENIEHTEARILGKEKWYAQYQLRICKVEHEYGFKK